jgi:hypothetical protein
LHRGTLHVITSHPALIRDPAAARNDDNGQRPSKLQRRPRKRLSKASADFGSSFPNINSQASIV